MTRLAWNGEVRSTGLLGGARGARDDGAGGAEAAFLRNSGEDAGSRVTNGVTGHGRMAETWMASVFF